MNARCAALSALSALRERVWLCVGTVCAVEELRAHAGGIASHPLNVAIGYEGRRSARHKGTALSAEATAAEGCVQQCVVAGTAYQSGALPENVAAEPQALIELLEAKGFKVRLWTQHRVDPVGRLPRGGGGSPSFFCFFFSLRRSSPGVQARLVQPSDLEATRDGAVEVVVETDAVVVGSGAGGGVAAAVLTRAGLTVAALEKGPYVHPTNISENDATATRLAYESQQHLITADTGAARRRRVLWARKACAQIERALK